MTVRGRKRLGIDPVEGVRGLPANVAVGICHGSIDERRDCGDRLSLECAEGVCGKTPDCGIRALESGSKGWDGSLRCGLESTKNNDHFNLVSHFVRIEAGNNYRHDLLSRLSEIRDPVDGFEGYDVSGVLEVCNSRQEQGQFCATIFMASGELVKAVSSRDPVCRF